MTVSVTTACVNPGKMAKTWYFIGTVPMAYQNVVGKYCSFVDLVEP